MGGYVLACDPAAIDAHRFAMMTARAAQEGDPARRLAVLDEALAPWRGPALAGVSPEPVRLQLCRHLEEARLAAVERRLATLLDLGRHEAAIVELTRLAGEHPDRYRLTELLMAALHHTGRSATALVLYREVKNRLAEDLGMDPPDRLQRMEVAILRNDRIPPARMAG